MSTFIEGIQAAGQACSVVVAIPALGMLLLARRARLAVTCYFIAGAALLMWAQAAGHWGIRLAGGWLVAAAVVAAAAYVSAALAPGFTSTLATGAGLIGGAVAGWGWRPCVGTRLGDVLDVAAEPGMVADLSSLAWMLVYTSGTLLPVLLIAAFAYVFSLVDRVLSSRVAFGIGGLIAAAHAVTLASGWYDDLVGELFRITNGL